MLQEHEIRKILAVILLGTALTSCAMFEGRETAGEYVDDATITTRIKADILGDPALKVLQINVETMQGVVQLSGFVDSAQSEQRAVSIARHEKGVTSVKDALIIR
jgi:osmotically-inducible protein OsmY